MREEEAGLAIATANVALQEATVERAEANLHKAELDLGRAAELVRQGRRRAGRARHRDRRPAKRRRRPRHRQGQVENAKATLAQRQATLDSARIDLERTYIRSPIDGVVIDRTVEVGQTVAASMTAPKLFTIAQDLAHVQIEAQVDEADIGQVTSDNPVSFTVDAYPDVTFKGTVEQIRLAPIALNNVVTYTVVIAADNPFGRLLPGMTANVEIVTGEHKDVVVVPNEALRFQPRGPAQAALSARCLVDRVGAARRRARRAPAGQAQGRARADAEEKSTRSAPRSRPSSPRSEAPARPAPAPTQEDAREQARMRIAKVLRAVLTPEQYKKYEEMAAAAARRARAGDGVDLRGRRVLVRIEVRLGLADGNVTEVTDGLGPRAPTWWCACARSTP